MIPPNNWDWADGTIKHIDMRKKLKKDLSHLIDGYLKENKNYELYFHKEDPAGISASWEDYAFHWLDEHEDNVFHSPGPSLVKRCEFLNVFISLLGVRHRLK
jgi:hypothetical protein